MSLLRLLAGVPTPAGLVRTLTRMGARRRLRAIDLGRNECPLERRQRNLESVVARDAWVTPTEDSSSKLKSSDLPGSFLRGVFGKHEHTACACWPRWAKDIDRAVHQMFLLISDAAELDSAETVLEVSTHPGAAARWLKANRPTVGVTPLEATQPALADHSPPQPYDRILAIEPFGQVANPQPVLELLLRWLAPGGRLFVQVPSHWRQSYTVDSTDDIEALLPDISVGTLVTGADLVGSLDDTYPVSYRRELSGEHYQRTARAWCRRLETQRRELTSCLKQAGRPTSLFWRWRTAFLAQEALFGFREGQEWWLAIRTYGR